MLTHPSYELSKGRSNHLNIFKIMMMLLMPVMLVTQRLRLSSLLVK